MTPKRFYIDLLDKIAVPLDVMTDARTKRDELRTVLERVVGARITGTKTFASGALAQATQIKPLNDVDIGVVLPRPLPEWVSNPLQAMLDVKSWIEKEIPEQYEISTHAIKISFPDQDFTADIVIGITQQQGILLPHCPKDELHRWIPSDPAGHRDLVLGRNTEFRNFGPSIFSKEIRILKQWNRERQLRDTQERKPLASFHITALTLKLLTQPAAFEHWTPFFFEHAADLVWQPLDDPSGGGEPIETKDKFYASTLLRDAGEKTRAALTAAEEEAERLLTDVFGRPDAREALLGRGPVSVSPSGALIAGLGGVASGGRAVRPVRSHGDGG
jgi:hypothetical protein